MKHMESFEFNFEGCLKVHDGVSTIMYECNLKEWVMEQLSIIFISDFSLDYTKYVEFARGHHHTPVSYYLDWMVSPNIRVYMRS